MKLLVVLAVGAVVALGVAVVSPVLELLRWVPEPTARFDLCLPSTARRATFRTPTLEIAVEVSVLEYCGYGECEPSDERWTSSEAEVTVSKDGSAWCQVSIPFDRTACIELAERHETVTVGGEMCLGNAAGSWPRRSTSAH